MVTVTVGDQPDRDPPFAVRARTWYLPALAGLNFACVRVVAPPPASTHFPVPSRVWTS